MRLKKKALFLYRENSTGWKKDGYEFGHFFFPVKKSSKVERAEQSVFLFKALRVYFDGGAYCFPKRVPQSLKSFSKDGIRPAKSVPCGDQ